MALPAPTVPARRGQGSFEYLMLLAGVLLIVVLITIFLRGTVSQVASGSETGLEQTLAAWNLYTNISLANVSAATPLPGTGTAQRAGTPVTACRDGTRVNTCVRDFAPLYCNAQGDYVDRCGACGCPEGLACDAATNKCGTVVATPAPGEATPEPTASPARGGADVVLAGLASAFDRLVQGFTGVYTAFFSFFREGGRVVFFLIAVSLAAIVAFIAYGFVKKRKL